MRLSTRGRYAVMAMAEIASRQGAGAEGCVPVSLSDIANAQVLSLAYLEQLFARLRRAGLVSSARGPGGGYRLGRPPAQIAIAEIVAAVDEAMLAVRCEDDGPDGKERKPCLTSDLWAELGDQIRLFLTHTSLADVVEGRVVGRAAPPRQVPTPAKRA